MYQHSSAILTGGQVPAHEPGAYPRLSCCGGGVELVPLTLPCEECGHAVHDDDCYRCDDAAGVGVYAPCSRGCSTCGSTETVELSDEHQSITICANCGSDEG